jgi:hypothetical protein
VAAGVAAGGALGAGEADLVAAAHPEAGNER